MLIRKLSFLAALVLAPCLPAVAQMQPLPAVPFPTPFPAHEYLEIDVTGLPEIPSESVEGCELWGPQIRSAKGDASSRDGCAFQAALNEVAAAGGGVVFIPAGTYFIDRTLLVGDNTWVLGAGPQQTILRRGPTEGRFMIHRHCDSVQPTVEPTPSLILFSNTRYNCGNTGMVLANFQIDGQFAFPPNLQRPGVSISFSAIEDTHIWNLTFHEVPQDGIFFRNGGVNTSIMNNLFDGFNMLWYNGAAINIEMYGNSNIGNGTNPAVDERPPVLVMGNTIISRTHHDSEVHGINFNRPTGNDLANANEGASPARALIQDNMIRVTNDQTAIACFDCIDSMIMNNDIRYTSGEGSGTFSGILVAGGDVQVLDNEVRGRNVEKDGRGILVGPATDTSNPPEVDPDIAPVNVLVAGNRVEGKRLRYNTTVVAPFSLAALEVRGIAQFSVLNNRLDEISSTPLNNHSAPGLVTGYCTSSIPSPTTDGVVAWNQVNAFDAPGKVYSTRKVSDLLFAYNEQGIEYVAIDDLERCHSSLQDEDPIVIP